MLSKDEIYNVWAPPDAPWSRWVKPVLFAFMDGIFEIRPAPDRHFDTVWVPTPGPAVILIDLPGEDAVLWGIQLARLGYRPIPLYNALPFPLNEITGLRSVSTVPVEPILAALHRETSTLEQIHLAAEAPPAFLLDGNRRIAHVPPAPGRFDNRSVCFPTDFPSAEFLLQHGIGSAILLQTDSTVAGDLVETLLSWQRSGIQIFRKHPGGVAPPSPVVVQRPSFLRSLWYRVSVALGLRRGELGGFGGIVPPSGG